MDKVVKKQKGPGATDQFLLRIKFRKTSLLLMSDDEI